MSRDHTLGLVAAICAIALAIVAWVQPPVSDQIIIGLVAIGSQALGRVSGANRAEPVQYEAYPPTAHVTAF